MALTAETIVTTWANNGIVQIETAADYNVFVTYLNSNPTAENMRNAEIIADIDYTGIDPVFYTRYDYNNLTVDGKGHSIKNIVKKNAGYMFFFVLSNKDAGTLKNITFENCYIARTGDFTVFFRCTLTNVRLKNCRFITNGSYYGVRESHIEDYSSAVTVRCGEYYYGVSGLYPNTKRIAILDTVLRTTLGGYGFAIESGDVSGCSHIFTRNRFVNFEKAYGIVVYNNTVSMSYAAITAENATSIVPLYCISPQNAATYYDNTLVPNAGGNVSAGLPTTTLKSVSAMQQAGFEVEAI